MRLSSISTSISSMKREDALKLIISIRKSRRTYKPKPGAVKKEKAKGTPMSKIQTLLKGLGNESIEELINMLEEEE